jgi:hypothetical protein
MAPYPAWSCIGTTELITVGTLVEIRVICRTGRDKGRRTVRGRCRRGAGLRHKTSFTRHRPRLRSDQCRAPRHSRSIAPHGEPTGYRQGGRAPPTARDHRRSSRHSRTAGLACTAWRPIGPDPSRTASDDRLCPWRPQYRQYSVRWRARYCDRLRLLWAWLAR